MTVVLVLLTGIIFGAICVGCFAAGYYFGQKKEDNGIQLTKENKELVEAMAEWKNFDGR